MTGWLGDTYFWVRAAHLIFVIFWMAGMFMLPRYLVYMHPTLPGSDEERLWIERVRRLRRIILDPSIIIVWLLGLALAFHIGFAGNIWLYMKIAIVLGFSGFYDWMARLSFKMTRGERPVSERALRILNEVPSLVTIIVVILAVVKPF